MKARIRFEVESPNENATKEEFESWINFQIGKNSELPNSVLTNENLELIDPFADSEIIMNASVEIIDSEVGVGGIVSLQTADSLYPTCDKIFHETAFRMVEDYLDAGYYDEARNELQAMIDMLKHDYPDRDESLHYNNDLTRVGKKSSLSK